MHLPLLRELVCNNAAADAPITVNFRTLVSNADIRRETVEGREHIVLPSYTLPDGVVMNGGRYLREEIDAAAAGLEDTLAPMGHPTQDGKFISANTPLAINAYHVGAFNKNVQRRGNRLYVEKWIDVEVANSSDKGRKLLEAIEKKEPVHTSVAAFLTRDFAANGDGYEWTARNMVIDHDAILLDQVGAATPEQGVGLMVNTAEARSLEANLGPQVLGPESWRNQWQRIATAVTTRFAEQDKYAYLEDFDDETLVYCTPEGTFQAPYHRDGDNIVIGEAAGAVEQRQVFFAKNSIMQKIAQLLGFGVDSEPVIPNSAAEDDQEMTPEEKAALAADIAKTVGETLAANIKAAVDPVIERLGKVETTMQANTDAAEAEMREAVKAKFGEEVAKDLTGNALAALHKQCLTAAPLIGGRMVANSDKRKYEPVE